MQTDKFVKWKHKNKIKISVKREKKKKFVKSQCVKISIVILTDLERRKLYIVTLSNGRAILPEFPYIFARKPKIIF